MHEALSLDIKFKGKTINLQGWLQIWDYEHRIEIEINNIAVIFEFNETLEYVIPQQRRKLYYKKLSPKLLHLVAQRLTFMFFTDHFNKTYI